MYYRYRVTFYDSLVLDIINSEFFLAGVYINAVPEMSGIYFSTYEI